MANGFLLDYQHRDLVTQLQLQRSLVRSVSIARLILVTQVVRRRLLFATVGAGFVGVDICSYCKEQGNTHTL